MFTPRLIDFTMLVVPLPDLIRDHPRDPVIYRTFSGSRGQAAGRRVCAAGLQ